MKTRYYIIPLIICTFFLSNNKAALAQDYKIVIPGHAHYFQSVQENNVAFQYYNNSFSWSSVKVAWIDSSASVPGGTMYFPFHTWRDTSYQDSCDFKYGPSWMGMQILDFNNGTTWLFNEQNDSILFETQSSPGVSWIMAKLDSGRFARATVDSIVWTTQSGIQDSVKCISLLAEDQFGVPVNNHPVNGFSIRLSKSNGLFYAFSFREFPAVILPVERIDSIPMISDATVYNFDVGDEFEYMSSCYGLGGGPPPQYHYYQIISKFFNLTLDSVSYCRSWNTRTWDNTQFPPVEIDNFGLDTVTYPYNPAPYFTAFPEENTTIQVYPYSLGFGTYSINMDSTQFNARPVYSKTLGFMSTNQLDSCLTFINFEPLLYYEELSAGLGLIYQEQDYTSQAGQDCKQQLIWYHKGSETWGNFLALNAGSLSDRRVRTITIFPNPSCNICMIRIPGNKKGELYLSDLQGRVLFHDRIEGEVGRIDISRFDKGVYLLEVRNPDGLWSGRLVKK